MDLEKQLLAMGMSPEEAKKYANNFVVGLKELGFTEQESKPEILQAIYNSDRIGKLLLKVGVRPNLVQKYSKNIDHAMTEFFIDTDDRQRMFLTQILHESDMLTATVENLNYSELGLLKVFKKYFDASRAKKYARNPQKIANRVYANRMGNGNEDSGDGWKFRGRGLIQLTGRDNYKRCGDELGIDLIKDPSYLETPEGAARSAGWFWLENKLNQSADKKDIETNTRIINGGTKGLDQRKALYQRLQ